MTTESNTKKVTLRRRWYELLETSREEDTVSRIVDIFLVLLICLNIMAVILESVDSYKAEFYDYFNYFERFSVAVFTIEYFLRLWSIVEKHSLNQNINNTSHFKQRIRYIFSPMAIVDLLSILPFYLIYFFQIDLRFLRVLRILRIFKLTRYSESMTTLLTVLRRESDTLSAAFFVLLVIMTLAASGVYLVENKVQPEVFKSIPDAMWWAVVTLTTVGYGDVTPITPLGKLLAATIMIAGVGLVALPAGILASSFSENLDRNKSLMTKRLEQALADGIIDENEQESIEYLRRELGISESTLKEIRHAIMDSKHLKHDIDCPHCGKSFNLEPKKVDKKQRSSNNK